MYQWTLPQSGPLRNRITCLPETPYGSGYVSVAIMLSLSAFTDVRDTKEDVFPLYLCLLKMILILQRPPAQFFSLPLINSKEFPFLIFRVLIFRTGRKVSKESQKMFRIGLRNEWFYLFIFLIYWGIFSVILILRHKWTHIINSIFIVDTILKNLCFAYLLIYLLKHPQEEFFLFCLSIFLSSFLAEQGAKADKVCKGRGQAKKEFL